jgi:hypothetical protein
MFHLKSTPLGTPRDMNQPKKTHVTFSKEMVSVSIALPDDWEDLNDDQLRYVCRLKACGCRGEELGTYAAVRWSGLEVSHNSRDGWQVQAEGRMFPLEEWQLMAMARRLSWLDRVELPVRPSTLRRGLQAIDAYLHGMQFGIYLRLQNYWAAFLATEEPQYLREVAAILFQGDPVQMLPLDGMEQCIVVQWMMGWQAFCRKHWAYLFQGSGEGDLATSRDMEVSMLAQIRALTGGDVTKEQQVLELDVWSALNELNAKIRDAEAERKQLKNLRHGI